MSNCHVDYRVYNVIYNRRAKICGIGYDVFYSAFIKTLFIVKDSEVFLNQSMLESGDIMIKFQTINVMNQLLHFGERLHYLIKL